MVGFGTWLVLVASPFHRPLTPRRVAPFVIGGILVVIVFIGLIWLINKPAPPHGPTPPSSSNSLRLSRSVYPTLYEIELDVEMEPAFQFAGKETIAITVTEPTDSIFLHSLRLDIKSISLTTADTVHVDCPGSFTLDEAKEFLVFTCPSLPTLVKNTDKFLLHIEFDAPISSTTLEGFYRSSYTENGVEQWIAVTDFEPANARNAFPCFDEPAMKAVFKFTINVPAAYKALGNMPSIPATLPDGRTVLLPDHSSPTDSQQYKFVPTEKQSTYLVCYAVHKFASTQPVFDKDGKRALLPSLCRSC